MAREVQIPYLRSRLVDGSLNAVNLEQAIRQSLARQSAGTQFGQDASLRASNAAGDYGTLVLNDYNPLSRGIFLEFVRFAPGSQIPLIETRRIGQRFSLSNANTPDGHDLIKGYAYATVIEDHILSLSRDFSQPKLELYVEDFLSSITRQSSSDLKVHFLPEIDVEGLPEVGEVVFRPRSRVVPRTQSTETSSIGPSTITAGAIAWDVLRAACFTDSVLDRLQLQGIDFDVKLEVVFKQGRSRQEVQRADISELLREVPDEGITLKSHLGNERKGRIRRISYPAIVETVGDLFDRNSAASALMDAYRHFRRGGFIS
ncbi:hypothetical protein [Salinarimonas ramus]|uniref:hypothetical protein n=1 Tax=Salinarimonas ramus TaxID=690164 RepID=UPI001662D855|nr:hypothetical protein [Salinarimonas ramus]